MLTMPDPEVTETAEIKNIPQVRSERRNVRSSVLIVKIVVSLA